MAELSRSGRAQRPKSPTRLVTVERVVRVSPRLTRITFVGDSLAEFGPPRPGAHMKLLFVADHALWSPDDEAAARPPRRTYTPRRFDPDGRELDIEFVHHGNGLAATWAAKATRGDQLYINGPGGGYNVAPDTTELVLIADDTALPAAGTIIEAMPKGCRAIVVAEVADKAEQRLLSQSVDVSPNWLFRKSSRDGPSVPGALLVDAVETWSLPTVSATAQWWVACEATAMRRIRQYLISERGIDPAHVHSRGYWKLGETAYPDHDFGKD